MQTMGLNKHLNVIYDSKVSPVPFAWDGRLDYNQPIQSFKVFDQIRNYEYLYKSSYFYPS